MDDRESVHSLADTIMDPGSNSDSDRTSSSIQLATGSEPAMLARHIPLVGRSQDCSGGLSHTLHLQTGS